MKKHTHYTHMWVIYSCMRMENNTHIFVTLGDNAPHKSHKLSNINSSTRQRKSALQLIMEVQRTPKIMTHCHCPCFLPLLLETPHFNTWFGQNKHEAFSRKTNSTDIRRYYVSCQETRQLIVLPNCNTHKQQWPVQKGSPNGVRVAFILFLEVAKGWMIGLNFMYRREFIPNTGK